MIDLIFSEEHFGDRFLHIPLQLMNVERCLRLCRLLGAGSDALEFLNDSFFEAPALFEVIVFKSRLLFLPVLYFFVYL